MLSGVELHLPRQIVAPASSTTQTEVCSRETSSPHTAAAASWVVLRFVTTEAPMLQARAPAITGCPDLSAGRAPRAAAVKDAAAQPASPAEPARSVPRFREGRLLTERARGSSAHGLDPWG